jgi:hypothetical protein
MKEITKCEMDIILKLVKSPEIEYNANSLAKAIKITPMGALKILKRLEKESILKSRNVGRARIYKINLENHYAIRYVSLILSREALHANPYVKRWILELKKIKNAEIIILFGSVLEKNNPNDIDVVFVTDKKKFLRLKKEIENINKINITKIHPLYQTIQDIIANIKNKDAPILNAIKGIVVKSEERFLEVYNESRKE